MSDNSQGVGRNLVLLFMILAIILAVGVFMAIMVVNNRPTPQERAVNINGEFVTLQIDPNNRPVIQPEAAPAAEEAPAEPETVVVDENQVTVESLPTAVSPTAPPEAAAETTGTGGTVAEKYIFTNYVVQPQDTLYSLALNNNSTIALLARFGTAKLIPGQTVVITTANPNFCPGKRPYIVEEGDTAFAIAIRYGITVQQLAELNGYTDGNIPVYVTDVICVP